MYGFLEILCTHKFEIKLICLILYECVEFPLEEFAVALDIANDMVGMIQQIQYQNLGSEILGNSLGPIVCLTPG